jgi:hypothetical protein
VRRSKGRRYLLDGLALSVDSEDKWPLRMVNVRDIESGMVQATRSCSGRTSYSTVSRLSVNVPPYLSA